MGQPVSAIFGTIEFGASALGVCLGAKQSFPLFSQLPPFPPIFCPRVGDSREGRGDVANPAACEPPRRQRLVRMGSRRE